MGKVSEMEILMDELKEQLSTTLNSGGYKRDEFVMVSATQSKPDSAFIEITTVTGRRMEAALDVLITAKESIERNKATEEARLKEMLVKNTCEDISELDGPEDQVQIYNFVNRTSERLQRYFESIVGLGVWEASEMKRCEDEYEKAKDAITPKCEMDEIDVVKAHADEVCAVIEDYRKAVADIKAFYIKQFADLEKSRELLSKQVEEFDSTQYIKDGVYGELLLQHAEKVRASAETLNKLLARQKKYCSSKLEAVDEKWMKV